MLLDKKVIDTFWRFTINNGSDTCWDWIAYKDKDGYGKFDIENKKYLAHRVSFMIHNPTINITNLLVLHYCDNPSCSNPSHLFFGTVQDNVDDRNNKFRQNKGFAVNTAKVTEEIVKNIRVSHENGEPVKSIMARTGLSKSQIHAIIKRKSWKHVN